MSGFFGSHPAGEYGDISRRMILSLERFHNDVDLRNHVGVTDMNTVVSPVQKAKKISFGSPYLHFDHSSQFSVFKKNRVAHQSGFLDMGSG